MSMDPKDSLRATFWGLFFIWWAGGIGIVLALGNPLFGVVYAISLGPVLYMIYQAAKLEKEAALAAEEKRNRKAVKKTKASRDE